MEIKQTEQELVAYIMQAYNEYINNVLQGAAMAVQRRVTDCVKEALMNAPEVQSILSGDLRQQLGLTNPDQIVDQIITAVVNNIQFKQENVRSIGDRIISGGYTIEVSRSDFQDVLSIPDASFVSVNNILIPWLNWLLFAGDTPVVIGYVLEAAPNNQTNSRTGVIMVRQQGGSWAVPSEFSGTANDNFITRALLPIQDEIGSIIQEEMNRRL